MGIVEDVLAEFELSSGTEYTVEYNESGLIHVHMDEFTLAFTPEEFLELVDLVESAHTELADRKPHVKPING